MYATYELAKVAVSTLLLVGTVILRSNSMMPTIIQYFCLKPLRLETIICELCIDAVSVRNAFRV